MASISARSVELVVIDIVQEHIHTRHIVIGMIYLLSEEPFFYKMVVELLFCLQQQRTRTASGIINFIDRCLPTQSQSSYQLRYILWSKLMNR